MEQGGGDESRRISSEANNEEEEGDEEEQSPLSTRRLLQMQQELSNPASLQGFGYPGGILQQYLQEQLLQQQQQVQLAHLLQQQRALDGSTNQLLGSLPSSSNVQHQPSDPMPHQSDLFAQQFFGRNLTDSQSLLDSGRLSGLISQAQLQQPQASTNSPYASLPSETVAQNYAAQGVMAPWSANAVGLLGSMVAPEAPTTSPKAKKVRRKPKDRPKRPLSAYNIFFKEERQRILKGIPDEEDKKKPAKSTTDDAADDKDGGKRKKSPHGKIGFESLAKMIGQRWQDLPPKEVNYYKEKAKTDMDRYKTEMEAYLSKQSKVAAAAALAGGDNDEQDDSDIR